MILDSRENLNIFRNAALIEQIKKVMELSKWIHWASGLFYYEMIGNLTSDLGALPLPDSDYYYSPDGMVNILSLAILSKTHRIYMDTAVDNAFYMFNKNGRYIRFFNCPITNFCWLFLLLNQENNSIQVWTAQEQRSWGNYNMFWLAPATIILKML